MSVPKSIKVTVLDTDTILFEGTVDRITSFNEMGKFDVYPLHANFISILTKQLSLYQKNQKIKELQFEQAVMKVKKDNVDIFLGIEILLLDDNSSGKNTKSPQNNTSPPPNK